MARGYPDFFGYSTFPWHGAVTEVCGAVNVLAAATVSQLTLAGKRVIYNVYCETLAAADHSGDFWYLYIDGVQISASSYAAALAYNYSSDLPCEPKLILYNQELFDYMLYFNGIFSVGQSIELLYRNTGVGAITPRVCIECSSIV